MSNDWIEKHKNDIGGEWTPEVIYKIYRNDDLNTLPVSILVDMKKYIDEIISNKITY